jgi:hypothetical protein
VQYARRSSSPRCYLDKVTTVIVPESVGPRFRRDLIDNLQMHTWFLEPCPVKPDFRLVITFLWRDLHNVDTDGDSYNAASRTWTELYVMNREDSREVVEVDEVEARRVRVRSTTPWLAAAVAFFLAEEGGVAVSRDGVAWLDRGELRGEVGVFDLDAAIARAATSVWRRATLADLDPEPHDSGW